MPNGRILIIDDDASDLKGMSVALEKAGYGEILTADSAEAGLENARTWTPDAVIIDVVLNHKDGLDLAKQIKSDGSKTKVIMVTGHLEAVDARKARNSGADEIIEKNFGFTQLAPVLKRFL